MHIKHWKKIAFSVSTIMHIAIWYCDFLSSFEDTEVRDLMSDLFTSSVTLIGFIFAIITILITITEHSLIKEMIKNGMYSEIMKHLKYLIIGFSITMLSSYIGSLVSSKNLLSYILFFTSFIFTYNIIMLVGDMFRRLTLTFINLK